MILNNFLQHFKPIFVSIAPNVQKDDLRLVFRLRFKPRQWKKGSALEALESSFKRFLGVKHAFTFVSGRTGFWAILKSLNLNSKDEILIQSFTCNAVVNPILNLGLKPVFVDISQSTLNLNMNDLEKKISSKSRAVVVQHAFGLPADMDKVLEICKKHNLILIEDCAHSLGAEYKGKKIGTFGKASFFSFGRDKIISSVSGGMVVTNSKKMAQGIKKIHKNLEYPSFIWIEKNLNYLSLSKLLSSGFWGLGRWDLFFLQKLKLLPKAVSKQEKQGQMPKSLFKKMPNALAAIALNQFKKLNKILEHQKSIAMIYNKNLKGEGMIHPKKQEGRVYLKYPIILNHKNTNKVLASARKQKIFLNDGWRKSAIVPPDTNQRLMKYSFDCKTAEKVAKYIINLPTHINISEKKALRVVNLIKNL